MFVLLLLILFILVLVHVLVVLRTYYNLSLNIGLMLMHIPHIAKLKTTVVLDLLNKHCISECKRFAHINNNLKNLLLKMPRNKDHIADAQKQRVRIKEKSSRYIPGTVNLQILGSGAPGAPASVYLFTDQSRLDNSIESFGRF